MRVFIIRARNLIKADITFLGKGKSDPFVRVKGLKKIFVLFFQTSICFFKAQGDVEYKTKTIDNTTDPEWNEVDIINYLFLDLFFIL